MKRPLIKHQGPYDETNTYNFTFRYPLAIEQKGSTSVCALGGDDSSHVGQANMGVSADGRHAYDHDCNSPDERKAKTAVKGQQHDDTVS